MAIVLWGRSIPRNVFYKYLVLARCEKMHVYVGSRTFEFKALSSGVGILAVLKRGSWEPNRASSRKDLIAKPYSKYRDIECACSRMARMKIGEISND